MQTDYTHMTVILDRSGSMEPIREDIIGGFNAMLSDQKAQPGRATLTVVQFDGEDPYEVIHRFKPLQDVSPLDRTKYVPRGSTPLFDAVGRGINDIDGALAMLPEESRPRKVIFAIVTDGQENASTEFRKEQVTKMIKAKSDEGVWEFVFLSADLAAFHEGGEIGIHDRARMLFDKDGEGASRAFMKLSAGVLASRSSAEHQIDFSEEDQKPGAEPDEK